MKKIILLSTLLFSGCDIRSQPPFASQGNPVYQAADKIGLQEQIDRQELKAYLGVDPVHTEWCAAFVNSVLEESNIPNNTTHEYPLTARAFLDWGINISKDEIQPGDVVVFPRGNQGWQGHVGFYISTIELENELYYTILGGNQDDKVSIDIFKVSTVLGIRRNEY